MSAPASRESRNYILTGLLLILLGSGLLLVCKTPLPEIVGSICAYAGGAVLLWGNFRVIFGLLVSAGDRDA